MRNIDTVNVGAPLGGPLQRLLRAKLTPAGMLALAAALAAGVAAAGWAGFAAHGAPQASRTQIEEWQAMVTQATEPRALQRLRELARHGSGDAQTALGTALLGSREAALRDEGLGWLRTAARPAPDGRPGPASARAAQLALGKAMLLGSGGVERDYPHALALLRPVAAAGDPAAAYYLGLMYRSGYGTPADPAAAARWFEQAARQDIPAAQFMLANAYRDGSGVPRDEARALELYRHAADHELPEAVQTLAMAYRNGELGLARDDDAFHSQWLEAAHALKHPVTAP
ncbi:tetratricopeptide repeat protein [Burkholderia alba]|uniref:tetratricopeptide repeat protein n=1 Tax=Burkholderia alba TaxID=2683677 RepID=UPI002B062446|nr:tetratricopeptide repeat protein [Burkholderia alba]